MEVPEDHETQLNEPAGEETSKHHQALFESESYQWLLATLERECRLTQLSACDEMKAIRAQVTAALPLNRRISHHQGSESYQMGFLIRWAPKKFLRDQYGSGSECFLREVITLTGSNTNAQAASCADYMHQTWPWSGSDILGAVSGALQTGKMTRRMQTLPSIL